MLGEGFDSLILDMKTISISVTEAIFFKNLARIALKELKLNDSDRLYLESLVTSLKSKIEKA